jgi:hypothetical protein
MAKNVTKQMNVKIRIAKAHHFCKSAFENKSEATITQIMLKNVRLLTNLQLN